MLVLSRKKNQSIVIDGGIEIQILQLKGGTVKIGINAPDNIRIVRGELEQYSDEKIEPLSDEQIAAAVNKAQNSDSMKEFRETQATQ